MDGYQILVYISLVLGIVSAFAGLWWHSHNYKKGISENARWKAEMEGDIKAIKEGMIRGDQRFSAHSPKPVSYTHLTLPTTPYV